MMKKIEYDQIADDYARYRSSDLGAIQKLLTGSGITPESRVLEIGCGTGNYISRLQSCTGCDCSGIDPSPEMILQAKKQNGSVAFSVGSAEGLHFADNMFNFVFSVDVIHHVQDSAAYFREAYRVLKRSALLATLTDSEDTIRKRHPLAFYFPEIVEHELKRYPTIDELKRRSKEAGFEVVCEEVVETPFELNDIERYRNKAFSCLRLISDESFVIGIEKMRKDLENGPISCISRNYIIWNRKQTANNQIQPIARQGRAQADSDVRSIIDNIRSLATIL